jgi:hypothetical protein
VFALPKSQLNRRFNRRLSSSSCRESHLITSPATLLSEIFFRIDTFIAKPAVSISVLEIFQRARRLVGIGGHIFSFVIIDFFSHGNLLCCIRLTLNFALFIFYMSTFHANKNRRPYLINYWRYFGMIQTLTVGNQKWENQGMGAKLLFVRAPLIAILLLYFSSLEFTY